MKQSYRYSCERCGLEVITDKLPTKIIKKVELPEMGTEIVKGFMGINNIVRGIVWKSHTFRYYLCPSCKGEK